MEKVSKIYINKDAEFRLRYVKKGVATVYCDPSEKDKVDMVEYTNISDKWHDILEITPYNEISEENPVVVYCKEECPMIYIRYDVFYMAKIYAHGHKEKKVQWAYLKDLLP